jgi:hypothetical protein
MKILIIFVLIGLVFSDELPTVTELDIFAYLGEWLKINILRLL